MLAGVIASPAMVRRARAQEERAVITVEGKRPMVVYNDRPEDLETPLDYFNTWLTPNDVFFVRQHLPRPQVTETDFRLTFGGKVTKTAPLTLADLSKLPATKVAATLECTGNGRGFYRPRVPGIQWGRGAIGNAEWSGPRLADVLKMTGADLAAGYVTVNAADNGVAKTPDFIRSLPMRKALHEKTILATTMNGEPLPAIHGFPLRLIVPGWDGTSWVKWVNSIAVADEMDKGFYMNPAYRAPRHAVAPGTPADPKDLEVIEGMPVKSFITSPIEDAKVGRTAVTVRGFAWAGENRVVRVDVSTDGGSTWREARLSKEDLPFAWRLWQVEWRPADYGYFNLLSRATDSAGRVQPTVAQWNPSGYLYNAMDRVGVLVVKA